MAEIKPGIEGIREIVVTEEVTAAALGSGLLPVYGTPSLVALMEETCHLSVGDYLEEGTGTVGISMEIKHVSATPIGMKVKCHSELIQVEGRKLTFNVEAYDEKELIGTACHERFIIDNEKFMTKVSAKA